MKQPTIGDDSVGLFGVLTASTDIETIVEQMRDKAYSDGIEFERWYENIFSLGLGDIRKLPPALLDTKEALPPIALLPTDKSSLVVWLQRLMLTVSQDVNYDILIEGWQKRNSAGRAFNEHIEDFWSIRNWKPYFFESLVGGRFQPLIRYLRCGCSAARSHKACVDQTIHHLVRA